MGDIVIELRREDIEMVIENGRMQVPLDEGIIDGEPSVILEYNDDGGLIP